MNKVFKVTREELFRIYDVACDDWKHKLRTHCGQQLFNDKLEFTHEQVRLMIDASNESQLNVVKSVFHEYVEEQATEFYLASMESDDIFRRHGSNALIAINISDYKSFYLNINYTWELSTHRDGNQILIPTRK
jgi:hypothetical protein